MSSNITWHASSLQREERETRLSSKGVVIWLTGLSGSGKSTIARALELRLVCHGIFAYGLDGDNIRFGLCSDLGFSAEDRTENIRRIGSVAQLFCDSGMVCICSFVSPYQKDRDSVRNQMHGRFVEVHIDCSVETCAERDPKGLYRRAMAGEIQNFTGISAPYEAPKQPEIHIDTASLSIDDAVQKIWEFLFTANLISVPFAPK